MLLVDLNQVMIANYMAQMGKHQNIPVDVNLFRHMVLNMLLSFRKKFHKHGEMILCADNTNFWRKDVFPEYKANRKKKMRDSVDMDWNLLFNALNTVRNELKEYSMYSVLHIDRAEADDIIATIVSIEGRDFGGSPILIISGDKDFIQLHKYSNVEQYGPIQKKFIKHDNPVEYLHEHVMRGDASDGVPNVLSDDDTFIVEGKRQKPLTKKKMDMLREGDVTTDIQRNIDRNRTMIDLSCIRSDIVDSIKYQYDNRTRVGKDIFYKYLVEYKLKGLLEHINEF